MTSVHRTRTRKRARRPDEARRARAQAAWISAIGRDDEKRKALLGTIGRPFV
jgi:hypothetical protein